MFIDDSTYKRNGKTYRRVLMRTSYRVGEKVKHKTVGNLSDCSEEEIQAIKLALKHKDRLNAVEDIPNATETRQGKSVGALCLLHQLAQRLGIVQALGKSRHAKLVLWMVYATAIEQGSRLSATRLAQNHAVCDILNLNSFTEDDLYEAMDWLDEHQNGIEQSLFAQRYGEQKPPLYLYDVTSSYLEGTENELAEFGYNRDGKKGKMQIVIGLLTDENGRPVSVEVFPGNTSDLSTFSQQVEKVRQRFGGRDVVFVGDRGMIKGPQIAELPEDCHYITAISKAQIQTLLNKGALQMELFDETVCETFSEGVRYILRRNPERAHEMEQTRHSKKVRLQALVDKENQYLKEHPKARVQTAEKHICALADKLMINSWVRIRCEDRHFRVEVDEEALAEEAKLDGCYVIRTDLEYEQADTQTVHDRYKDLSEVEWAFRTMKTSLLELRAIFVQKANRTRAHVFIIMLAYLLTYELRRLWQDVEMTIEEGLRELSTLCATEVQIGNTSVQSIPKPRESVQQLLRKAKVTLPEAIPCKGATVVTRKKLVSERQQI